MLIFNENTKFIEDLNAADSEAVFGENQFMDLTQEEFAATYLTTRVPANLAAPEMDTDEISSDLPNAAFTWVTKGAVGPVKNQGSCGSCWAFSATGVVEGYYAIYKGSLPNVSEQQLVDCSTSYGNQGCNGGWPASALNYVRDHGLVTGAEYPYTGRDGACRINSGPYVVASVVESASCATLTADVTKQPTSVAVDASNWSFYKSGTFSTCGKSVNHGVLVVGWDDQNNWIIKNSWGTTWGQNGYMTLKAGDTCAVCEYMANSYN
jgi:C1A family cysteine protease